MKKQTFALLTLIFFSATFSGCGIFETKDPLVAQVGDEKIYQSDINLVRILDPAMNRPEKKSSILTDLIANREMMIEARKKLGDPNEIIERRLDALSDRLLTRIYQQIYVFKNLGHTDKQLSDYYYTHSEEFKGDSCKSFFDCEELVARKLFLSENADSLNFFFAQNLKASEKPAEADVAYFLSSDSSAVAKIKAQLDENKSVDEIQGMARAKVIENQKDSIFSDARGKGAVFGADAIQTDGHSYRVIPLNTGNGSSYLLLKILARQGATSRSLEKDKSALENQFIENFRSRMMRDNFSELKSLYKMQLEHIPLDDGRKYYESHKDFFKTLQGYEIYAVENPDSMVLAKAIDKPLMLSDFEQLAETISTNDSVKSRHGLVGIVHEGESFPYGIGSLPRVFSEFRGKTTGEISSIMKSPENGRYEVFFMGRPVAPEQRPYEAVKDEVQKRMEMVGDFTLDSSVVLATANGKPLIYERDVVSLQNEIPVEERSGYTRARLLPMMLQWKAFAQKARDLDLDASWYYKAFRTGTRVDLYVHAYMDSLRRGTWNVSEKDLDAGYAKWGKVLCGGMSKDSAHVRLALFLTMPESVMKLEYYRNMERYSAYPDFESARVSVFNTLVASEENDAITRYRAALHQMDRIHLFDSTYAPLFDGSSRASLLHDADSAYKDRRLVDAEFSWLRLRTLYPSDDTLISRATFQLAQVENEQEGYDIAQKEYRAFYSMWPKSPDAEKALFTRGFILHENLKQDSAALAVFRDFAAKYPKSDLMESVNWLIKDIESKGKLAAELLDKISKEDAAGK